MKTSAALLKPTPSSAERIAAIVQALLAKRAVTRSIDADEDLRDAGLSSLDMVTLMLSVEADFDLTIPDAAMTPGNFRSVASIDALVRTLAA